MLFRKKPRTDGWPRPDSDKLVVRQLLRDAPKPNSWKYNFVEVSGHNPESFQTWGFCMGTGYGFPSGVNSKEGNSLNFCQDFVQEFGLRSLMGKWILIQKCSLDRLELRALTLLSDSSQRCFAHSHQSFCPVVWIGPRTWVLGETHSLAGEEGGGGQFRRLDRNSSTLYISCGKCETNSAWLCYRRVWSYSLASYWSVQQAFDSHNMDKCAISTLAFLTID